MKTKFATVTLTNNARSFMLCYCTKPKRTKTDSMGVEVLDRIAVGKSPRALAEQAKAMGLTLFSEPTEESRFYMHGTKQPSGAILDPVVDWNGNVVEYKTR